MLEENQTPSTAKEAKFDAYAKDYERLHRNSITASGEQPAYFADYKVDCLLRLVDVDCDAPILDYGCGVGSLTERLIRRFSKVSGFDPSASSIQEAKLRAESATFYSDVSTIPRAHFGVIVLANVLHHVPPAERVDLVTRLATYLIPARGMLVVFEHNPYNPITRRAVAACEFDDDAILLGPVELTRLLTTSGLVGAERRFIVFFPRALAGLRGLEPHLGWLPIGAQVMAVARAKGSIG
ncbi:MAG TPA: class I SAM-dependent methyltransferase [Polyangiaceae bacterium]